MILQISTELLAQDMPLTFFPESKLTSMDEVILATKKRFAGMPPRGFEFYLGNPDSVTVRRIKNCEEFHPAWKQGYKLSPKTKNFATAYNTVHTQCGPLYFLRFLEKAKRSKVRGITFNPFLLDELPPVIGNPSEDLIISGLNTGSSLQSLYRGRKVNQLDKRSLQISFRGVTSTISPLAFGDANGDGWEDIILYVKNETSNGEKWFDYLVLSRLEETKILRLIDSYTKEFPSNWSTVFKGCTADRIQKAFRRAKVLEGKEQLADSFGLIQQALGACQYGYVPEYYLEGLKKLAELSLPLRKKKECFQYVNVARNLPVNPQDPKLYSLSFFKSLRADFGVLQGKCHQITEVLAN